MNAKLQSKLKSLPLSSGVYLHKSKSGEIIYVGKAAVLKNRVKQYFLSSKQYDIKTKALIAEIVDTDWIETDSEIDALFLESELVKRYKPRYNVLLRDDKSQLYIRIDMKSEWPHVSYTRNPLDDSAEYFGPYFNGFAIKKAMRYLRKIFPYYISSPKSNARPDLDVHINLSPGSDVSSHQYKQSLRQLIRYIKGQRAGLINDIEKNMRNAASNKEFEAAARYRNQLRDLGELKKRIMFGDQESLSISKDQALSDIAKLLGLNKEPKRVEGYDISHMSGRDVVASMVVFTNGVSDRSQYRKFKTFYEQNNDFANMSETIKRRFSDKNIKSWGLADLILIDGGKGQLDAALSELRLKDIEVPCIGLMKKQEEIVIDSKRSNVKLDSDFIKDMSGYVSSTENYIVINLPNSSHIIKLLQRIRDESHRFAVSYHTVLKRSRQSRSALDDIPGIGPITKKKLLRKFGSVKAIKAAKDAELAQVLSPSKVKVLRDFLK